MRIIIPMPIPIRPFLTIKKHCRKTERCKIDFISGTEWFLRSVTRHEFCALFLTEDEVKEPKNKRRRGYKTCFQIKFQYADQPDCSFLA